MERPMAAEKKEKRSALDRELTESARTPITQSDLVLEVLERLARASRDRVTVTSYPACNTTA